MFAKTRNIMRLQRNLQAHFLIVWIRKRMLWWSIYNAGGVDKG